MYVYDINIYIHIYHPDNILNFDCTTTSLICLCTVYTPVEKCEFVQIFLHQIRQGLSWLQGPVQILTLTGTYIHVYVCNIYMYTYTHTYLYMYIYMFLYIHTHRNTQVYLSFPHSLNSQAEKPSPLIAGAEKLNIKPSRRSHNKSRTQILV